MTLNTYRREGTVKSIEISIIIPSYIKVSLICRYSSEMVKKYSKRNRSCRCGVALQAPLQDMKPPRQEP